MPTVFDANKTFEVLSKESTKLSDVQHIVSQAIQEAIVNEYKEKSTPEAIKSLVGNQINQVVQSAVNARELRKKIDKKMWRLVWDACQTIKTEEFKPEVVLEVLKKHYREKYLAELKTHVEYYAAQAAQRDARVLVDSILKAELEVGTVEMDQTRTI